MFAGLPAVLISHQIPAVTVGSPAWPPDRGDHDMGPGLRTTLAARAPVCSTST